MLRFLPAWIILALVMSILLPNALSATFGAAAEAVTSGESLITTFIQPDRALPRRRSQPRSRRCSRPKSTAWANDIRPRGPAQVPASTEPAGDGHADRVVR